MIVDKPSLFEGEEKEGRFVGVFTLFVAGYVPYTKIREQIDRRTFGQIYFGAGQQWKIDFDVVRKVLAKHLAPIIMIESMVPIPPEFFRDPRIFAMIPPKAPLSLLAHYWPVRDKVQIRVEIGEDDRFVFPLHSAVRNNFKDYDEDILLWSK